MNRIKYKLLNWLLKDICGKAKCSNCECGQPVATKGRKVRECTQFYIRRQAKKTWNIEEN